MRHILIICIAASLLFNGCSEKPERTAAKQVRKDTDKAKKVISDSRVKVRELRRQPAAENKELTDAVAAAQASFNNSQSILAESFEQACRDLENSIKRNSRAGKEAKAPAIMTNANLLFARALHIQANLPRTISPINRMLNTLSQEIIEVADLDNRRKSLRNSIEANNRDIQILQKTINAGTDAFPSLSSQLTEKTSQLNALIQEKNSLQAKADAAQKKANEIENLASDKLRRAESLSGNEKLDAQKEGYELRFSKKEYMTELQRCLDELAAIESRIAIAEPMKNQLQANIQDYQNKIADLRSAGGNAKLSAQIKEIESKLSDYYSSISDIKSRLKAAIETHSGLTDEIASLMDQATEKYDSVNSSSAKQVAKSRIAACHLWAATSYAYNAKFSNSIFSRLESTLIADEKLTGDFSDLIDTAKNNVVKYGKLGMEKYTAASEAYEKAGSSCPLLKSRILALYGKVTLGAFLGDAAGDTPVGIQAVAESDKAAETAAQVMEEAKKCDPDFATSKTARLFAGEIDYAPRMQVDLADYYEEIRKQFQSWANLRGEEKKAEVIRLLDLLEEMSPPNDPVAFEKILGPERTLLKDAMKKGFDEEEETEDFLSSSSFGTDPNSF